METKYIFLDIDGTLVDFQGKLADSALEALKAATANGHKLFVCTGRQRSQIYPWLLEKITFDGAVCSSGAYVMADGECIARHCFSKEYMAFLARYFTSLHAPYCVQTEHTLMLEKWCADAIVAHYLADGIDRGKINSLFGMTTVVESASELTSAEKLIYYGAPKGLGEVAADLGERFGVVRYSFGNMGDRCGEVTDSRYTKATGMAEILRRFGAPKSATIAFGDGDNDLEMMDFAEYGVAMGNATPALIAAADTVTDDINSDGLYNAFKKLGLI